MEFTIQSVRQYFMDHFQQEPLLVRSPGRINLIGEHTDYNEGFVMPAAIDKEIIFAIGPSDDWTSTITALNFNETFEIELRNPQIVDTPAWANYVLGVVRKLIDSGNSLKPFHCVFGGNIPAGAGLSSSAALECGFAFALKELNELNISKVELAKIGQWSEHNFVGVLCGIMDQFANMLGKEGHVIQLDCRSLAYSYFPMKLEGHSIVLFNSGVKHSLASSEYNIRRAECEEGIRILKSKNSSITSLRDVSLMMIEEYRTLFPSNVYDRCKYVVEEIERVKLAAIDLQRGDLHAFGRRMFDTHEGLSNLYRVSCDELDFLVSQAQHYPEVLGSRLMGGGFGGCTINIIQSEAVNRITENLQNQFSSKFKVDMKMYTVQLTHGTSLVLSGSNP